MSAEIYGIPATANNYYARVTARLIAANVDHSPRFRATLKPSDGRKSAVTPCSDDLGEQGASDRRGAAALSEIDDQL